MINLPPEYKEYTLSSNQVNALFSLLSGINLLQLERDGKINVVIEVISHENGKVISDLFFDDEFALLEEL